jgi:hypothetical protein
MIDSIEEALTVPLQAVIERNDQTWVLVREDGRLRPRAVETGCENDSVAQIVSGLTDEENVCLNPREFIDDLLGSDS